MIWSEGLTKETDSRLKKVSNVLTELHKVRDFGIPKGENHKGDKNPFYGRKHTKETIIKMSIKAKRRSNNGNHPPKGQNNKNFDKSLTKEHRKKLCGPRLHIRGDKSHLWQGGKSFEPYGLKFNKELKEKIRERDECLCQECCIHQDKLSYKLHTHHIDYNKKNNEPNNLISLCKNCHMQANFNRGDWIRYFQNKIREGAR